MYDQNTNDSNEEDEVFDIEMDETLEELEQEEKEDFGGHRLDTFSEAISHDGTYMPDEEYFEEDE